MRSIIIVAFALAVSFAAFTSSGCGSSATGKKGDVDSLDDDPMQYCPADAECKPCASAADCDKGWICNLQHKICVPVAGDKDVELEGGEPSESTEEIIVEDAEDEFESEVSETEEPGEIEEQATENEQEEAGELPPRCDDNLYCTNDYFDGSQCQYALAEGYCLIAGVCYKKDDNDPARQCWKCVPNAATDAFTANTGATCDDGKICTTNDKCSAGVCEGSSVNCRDDQIECTVEACDELGGGCASKPDDSLCHSGQTCDPVKGCAGVCDAGTYRCLDALRQKCDEFGLWKDFETCSEPAPICSDDGCKACKPGAERCEGNFRYVCGSDGEWSIELCLGPQPSCADGKCKTCDEGASWCGKDGGVWKIYSCAGGEWDAIKECSGATPMCGDLNDGQGNRCLECMPGAARCDGLSHQVCNAQGVWKVDPCPSSAPYCQDGACVICKLGAARCGIAAAGEQANDVYSCYQKADVTTVSNEWRWLLTCPADKPNCNNGVCGSCKEGDKRCSSDPRYTEVCDANGEWKQGAACPAGYFCEPTKNECMEGFSLYFNGTSKMMIPDNNDYDPNAEFTLEAWIYPTALSGDCNLSGNAILEKWDSWPIGTYLLAVCADFKTGTFKNIARFFAMVDDPATTHKEDYLNSATDSIKINAWNHVAVVWANDRIDLYVNGKREAHHANALGWRTPNTFKQNSLEIGSKNANANWGFKGYIDEIRVSKIARYLGATFTPQQYFASDDFTTGLWHFDDVTDPKTCVDTSGHHDGDNNYGATYSPYGVGETPQ